MTLGSHQKSVGFSQVHLTPKFIIDALGPFDLDPCAADPRPFDCAAINFAQADDGLSREWQGVVWLNPPFNRYEVGAWTARLAKHGSGIALLHARTETAWFRPIWERASAIMFLSHRIKFLNSQGDVASANSGAPPVLAAFGKVCAHRLLKSGLDGFVVDNWQRSV